MRSFILVVLALACPIGMCLIPMLLTRRHGDAASCHDTHQPDEMSRLRDEVALLRAKLEASQEAARR